ncbi:MAG: CHAD domain-containing protein [Leptolyngbyaceae cyanobacterium SL_7_1]|nr:CHAD domain-containing protein [Leptolyngbyaceae cyanobacterium SL_7_1]
MKKNQVLSTLERSDTAAISLGDYARQVIEQQYHAAIKQEQKVLADKKPEPLHQMRVGLRRLRTALKVFKDVVVLPKVARETELRDVARVLGELRDLDVQLASLQTDYRPRLVESEQTQLDKAIAALLQRRTKTSRTVVATLGKPRYQKLKAAYESWLANPTYKPLAELSLVSTLPDLLTPLLSTLLLHPGWLISLDAISKENSEILHDLRKACKHARYQAEFFTPFYGAAFQDWVNEIKDLQSRLGELHDAQVMTTLLADELNGSHLPDLHSKLAVNQEQAMSDWETIRHRYLSTDFRYRLHHVILNPSAHSEQ